MTMHLAAECIFWVCASLIGYGYFCYPVVLFVAYAIAQLKRDLIYIKGRCDRRVESVARNVELPTVTMLVPACNEEAHIGEKLSNLVELTYPKDKFEVIIVSDGSNDRTNEIIQAAQGPNVRTILLPRRGGKANALNHAATHATGSIFVLSDASTLLRPDGIQKLVRHFANESVGAACGSLEFIGSDESKRTEGVYWKYESALRIMEARLGATLTASGAYYAIRRNCYRPLDSTTVLDDFVVPMNIRKQGYRVVYDPEAVAKEFAEDSVAGEFRRRVRLAVGSFRALPDLLRTPMSCVTWFAFISHKLLRWMMPFLFIGLFLGNIALIGSGFYAVLFASQCLFYLFALAGMLAANRRRQVPYGLMCYFVCAMNLAFLVGFFRAMRGSSQNVWQRAN